MRLLAACALIAFSILSPLGAGATGIIVSPIRLAITKSGSATNLTLRNDTGAAVRFSVRSYMWTQMSDGTQALEPTDDLIVFPQIFTIAPAAFREIRIAYTGIIPPSERAYRIIATELAPEEGAAVGVQIRTRLSVPLFLVPPAGTQAEAVENATATRHGIAFDINERGSTHAFVLGLHVVGKDAAGTTLLNRDLPGWYLLPLEPRHYEVPASGFCARVTSLTIDAQLEGEPPLRTTLVPTRAC